MSEFGLVCATRGHLNQNTQVARHMIATKLSWLRPDKGTIVFQNALTCIVFLPKHTLKALPFFGVR